MQFTIERLFELIEERFGRFAATLLLAVVSLAILTFAVYTIVNYGAIPLFLISRNVIQTASFDWTAIKVTTLSLSFVTSVAGIAYLVIWYLLWHVRAKHEFEHMATMRKELERCVESCPVRKEAEDRWNEATGTLGQAKQMLDEAQAHLAQAQHITSEPQRLSTSSIRD